MDYFLEIGLRPDPEFVPSQLMNALFTKLHRVLVQAGNNAIGVSFPDARSDRPYLGERLRLHGSAAQLDVLMSSQWLIGMRDHVCVGELMAVPANVKYRVVRRVQAQSSPERLRRRYAKRHEVGDADLMERFPDEAGERLALPFVSLRSDSTGQHFRLFIVQGPLLDEARAGEFSCYGLSSTATVPWF
jgi:CRISPR-associated endonuclease Csy4